MGIFNNIKVYGEYEILIDNSLKTKEVVKVNKEGAKKAVKMNEETLAILESKHANESIWKD